MIRKVLISFLIFLVGITSSLYLPFPKTKLTPTPGISLLIVDRNNILLREVLSDEGGYCQWISLEKIPVFLIKATLVAEDRHFFLHPGINAFAITRSLIKNVMAGRIVSGGSTITQQLIRNIYREPRTIFSKMREAWLSLRLERTISKEEILEQYLNRVYYGNSAYGIEAASRLYFDKHCADLSLAESCFLASLPRSPSRLNPFRQFQEIKKRQKVLIRKMFQRGFINKQEMMRALEEKVSICPEVKKFRAPHFCDFILKKIPHEERRELSLIRTSLDYSLQEKVENLVRNHLKSIEEKGATNAAVIVLENSTGEILSMLGSKDFFDSRLDGQVNAALSLRQPGSTLKPFTYGLALENGMTAATIIDDVEIQFPTPRGFYIPLNYDRKYHGPLRLRHALACSYNIPAVSLLEKLGPDFLFKKLNEMGFTSLNQSPNFYGLGLTLGNGEVTLLELVNAYSTLARGGIYFKEKTFLRIEDIRHREVNKYEISKKQRSFSPQVAYLITHILMDKDARIPSFGYNSPLNFSFECAVKTGTSKNFRDNWTLGYTPRFTVGTWVGNFDGSPMHNISGVSGSGPLFRDIMYLLEKGKPEEKFKEPPGLIQKNICPISGKLPTSGCPGSIKELFIQGSEPKEHCPLHQINEFNQRIENRPPRREKGSLIRIIFPANGDSFKIDPILKKEYQIIKFKAIVDENLKSIPIEWWLNDKKIGISHTPHFFSWKIECGTFTLKARAHVGKNMIETAPLKFSVF